MAITLSLIAGHILTPALLLYWLAGGRFLAQLKLTTRLEAWTFFAAALSFLVYIVIAGAWGVVGYWLRPALALLTVLAAVSAARRIRREATAAPLKAKAAANIAVYGVFALIFWSMTGLALKGRLAPADAATLAFPLHDGVYAVGQGGASAMVNYHNTHRTQAYALDILQLNRFGLRARGLTPEDPSAYVIYGATVTSPCDGTVAWARDGLDDARGAQRETERPAGNAVAIDCNGSEDRSEDGSEDGGGDVTVAMGHFMKGSLAVAAGDAVAVGEPIARVGNSGNTTEPHLHIHAEAGPYKGERSDNPGLAIRFEGRFLVRGDLVFAGPLTRRSGS